MNGWHVVKKRLPIFRFPEQTLNCRQVGGSNMVQDFVKLVYIFFKYA